MDKRKQSSRYVVLDLGNRISTDLLATPCSMSLEVQRSQIDGYPYSRFSVKKVIPCTFKKGKLYKL
ncbi:hypothetical protein GCM10025859_67690 [Alicyclobacillus fastidiosus]|nr:hypothetical protein GCM10025859_67200 [Alicyclobacillus fastidiosus]GMA66327.1 hypothetical protein GCM10025859_67690 [Alicyclobacillus fastidiosus]